MVNYLRSRQVFEDKRLLTTGEENKLQEQGLVVEVQISDKQTILYGAVEKLKEFTQLFNTGVNLIPQINQIEHETFDILNEYGQSCVCYVYNIASLVHGNISTWIIDKNDDNHCHVRCETCIYMPTAKMRLNRRDKIAQIDCELEQDKTNSANVFVVDENVLLTNGKGRLKHIPIGEVLIREESSADEIKSVFADGNEIDVLGLEIDCPTIKATYRYSAPAQCYTIKRDAMPSCKICCIN